MIPTRSIIHSVAVSVAALILTGACSSVPDAASPAHWYRSTVDYFSGDDQEKDKTRRAPQKKQTPAPAAVASSAAGEPAPATPAATPVEAKTPAPAAESTSVGEMSDRLARPSSRGLLADSGGNRPRYAPAISRQADDAGAPPSRAQTTSSESSAAPPPPASAPRAPVSAAPPVSVPAPAAPPPQVAEASRPSPPARPSPVRAAPPPASQMPTAKPEPAPQPTPSSGERPGDPRPASVDETYRTLLARQSQVPSPAGGPDDQGTMIISSEGIEMARRAPSALAADESKSAPAKSEKDDKSLGRFLDAAPGGLPGGGKLVRVATVQFPDGSAKLDTDARTILAQVARLQREKGGALRVVGHASMRTRPMDPDRHGKVNEGISIARANAVAQQLTRLGIKRDAIAVSGLGDSDPVYFEVMGTGEAGNRRAEIYMEF